MYDSKFSDVLTSLVTMHNLCILVKLCIPDILISCSTEPSRSVGWRRNGTKRLGRKRSVSNGRKKKSVKKRWAWFGITATL